DDQAGGLSGHPGGSGSFAGLGAGHGRAEAILAQTTSHPVSDAGVGAGAAKLGPLWGVSAGQAACGRGQLAKSETFYRPTFVAFCNTPSKALQYMHESHRLFWRDNHGKRDSTR